LSRRWLRTLTPPAMADIGCLGRLKASRATLPAGVEMKWSVFLKLHIPMRDLHRDCDAVEFTLP